MHRAAAIRPPHSRTKTAEPELSTEPRPADDGLAFLDIHARGRTAGLRRAVEASDRHLGLDDALPERVKSSEALLRRLGETTHVIVQSHGVGWTDADGIFRSEATLSNSFEVEADTLPPLPHLRFLMLAACYQGWHVDQWRRVAPNAVLVLANGAVHPNDFSKTIVDLMADQRLEDRLPTAERTEKILAAHRDRRWRIELPQEAR